MNATYNNPAKDAEQSVSSAADKLREGGKSAVRAAEDATTAVKRTAADAADTVRDMAGDAKDMAEDALAEGQSRLGGVIRKAQDTALDAKDAIVAGAGSTLATVRDVAVEKADSARETLSDVGERLANTLKSASADSDEDALKSRVLSSVAQGLTTATDALRQKSVVDLTSDVKSLARRHPGAFMVAAAVAGFAAARFVRSSSQRRMGRDDGLGPRV